MEDTSKGAAKEAVVHTEGTRSGSTIFGRKFRKLAVACASQVHLLFVVSLSREKRRGDEWKRLCSEKPLLVPALANSAGS
jgi:hypothetical protein